MRLITRGLAVLALAGLSGCEVYGPPINMNVTAYPDPERPVAAGARFAAVSVGQTKGGPLLEKNLLALVKQRLIAKGLIYDETNPEILVALSGYIGPFEEYVSPSTIYWPIPTQSTSQTHGSAYGSDGSSAWGNATTTTRGTEYVPLTTPGYTQTQYYRAIEVFMGEVKRDGDSLRVEPVWSGKVESSGSTGDLLTVAPTLLDELVGEFPARTGKPPGRTVNWVAPTPAGR